jgi:hypothetical protein
MGLDFIRKVAKSFHKGLDQSRIDLSTPDLFTRQLNCEPRAYCATIHRGKKVHLGEELSIRLHEGEVVAQRGLDVVATVDRPPTELTNALKQSFGEACGSVREVHDMAGTAEITVC